MRLRSIPITTTSTANAYQAGCTWEPLVPASRSIARSEMKRLATTRKPASASADRCSAFPWPNWCVTSAGRAATRTAKYVSSAATKSVAEWIASDTRPRLCVARPTLSLRRTSVAAAATDRSAERRCGVTRRRLRREVLERPDENVLPRREERVRLVAAERQRRHRVQVDPRLTPLQVPRRMVDLRAVRTAPVLRVEAVALGQPRLERALLGAVQLARAAVAAAERGAGPRRLVLDVLADPLAPHLRPVVRELEDPLRRLDGERARRVEREEPDAGHPLPRHVRADVQLREARHARERRQPAQAEVREEERGHSQPGVAVEGVELDRRADEPPELAGVDAPVEEREIDPGLGVRPRSLGQRPGAMLDLPEHGRLPRDGVEEARDCPGAPARARSPRRAP